MLSEKVFEEKMHQIFSENKSIAIVGAKDKAGTAVEHVGRYLMEQGYQIFPVHPMRKSAWGLACYKSLLDLEQTPDIVCLFRNSEACVEHAKEILTAPWRPKVFWMQLGIVSKEASSLMQNEGIIVIDDACMEVMHKKIFAKI